MQKKKRFVIYFLEDHLGAAPTVVGFVQKLAAAGHQVHLRTLRSNYGTPGGLPAACRIDCLSRFGEGPATRLLCQLFRKLGRPSVIPILELVWWLGQNLLLDLGNAWAQPALRRTNIGVDTRGGILALAHSALSGSTHVYLSLELPPPQIFSRLDRLVRRIDAIAIRRATAIVIQDSDRLRALSACYSKLPGRAFFLPNSFGPAAPSGSLQPAARANFFRTTLGIDASRFPHLVLQAGMLDDRSYAQELARAFAGITGGFALVLHDRVKRLESEPYIQTLRRLNSTNLFLSLEPVPLDQVDDLFAAATIGLAFYRPVDKNFSEISMASGKLAFSLKHGLPVVMNALPSFDALNQRYHFGLLISDPSDSAELASALGTIMANYEFYRTNARRCFAAEFDFDAKFEPLGRFLESI